MISTKKISFFFNGVLKFVLITILDAELHAILAENTKLQHLNGVLFNLSLEGKKKYSVSLIIIICLFLS